jgi:hypothetical protein
MRDDHLISFCEQPLFQPSAVPKVARDFPRTARASLWLRRPALYCATGLPLLSHCSFPKVVPLNFTPSGCWVSLV